MVLVRKPVARGPAGGADASHPPSPRSGIASTTPARADFSGNLRRGRWDGVIRQTTSNPQK